MTHSPRFTRTPVRLAAALAMVSAVAVTTLGCTPTPTAEAAVINDRIYTVTPDTLQVTAGIVTGELTEMKITERIEEGTGRITSPATLTGKLALKNVSADQTVRLIAGKILYIDEQGNAIELKDNRVAPTISAGSAYGAPERLDPGKDATQNVDVGFPAEALKAKKLKEIRLELTYIPSPFKEETLNFVVSIGGQKE